MSTIAILSDLHLTEKAGSIQAQCLSWAVKEIMRLKPGFVLLLGDMTAWGSPSAARAAMSAIDACGAKVVSTPGNAERRAGADATAVSLFSLCPAAYGDECAIATFDSSEASIGGHERERLRERVAAAAGRRLLLATHCHPEALDADSRSWLEAFMDEHKVKLLLCAHRHRNELAGFGQAKVRLMRGLDPEKAIGGPPAILVAEAAPTGDWSFREIPFTAPTDGWTQEEIHEFLRLLGLALIEKDSILDEIVYATENRIPCLELRHFAAELDQAQLAAKLKEWRSNGGRHLSWHLPNVKLAADGSPLDEALWERSVEALSRLGVQSATLHPPRVSLGRMRAERRRIAEAVAGLVSRIPPSVDVALENLHLEHGESDGESRGFGCLPEELLSFLEDLKSLSRPERGYGILLDCGHARNNGSLSTFRPLGDWLCDVGGLAAGYHIHQVERRDGRNTNHHPIASLYGPLIAYAGFLQAWRSRQISRRPVFIEVRGGDGRRSSYERLRELFLAGLAASRG